MISNERIKEILKQSEPREKTTRSNDTSDHSIKFNFTNTYKTANGNITIFSGGMLLAILLAVFLLFF